ncbi:MAG: hypothetical protein V3S17_05610 [candidate division Zixibacteria bacterium]
MAEPLKAMVPYGSLSKPSRVREVSTYSKKSDISHLFRLTPAQMCSIMVFT